MKFLAIAFETRQGDDFIIKATDDDLAKIGAEYLHILLEGFLI